MIRLKCFKHELLKASWTPEVDDIPAVVLPRGLLAECQLYLYDQIQPSKDMDSAISHQTGSRQGTARTRGQHRPFTTKKATEMWYLP